MANHPHKSTNGHHVKQQAHELVERLSDNAMWDDLMHQIYVRQAIESGMADSEAGRTVEVAEVRKRFAIRECV